MELKFNQISKQLSIEYTFNAEIERVWKLLMSHQYLLKSLFGDSFVSFGFTKENHFDKIGSEFIAQFKESTTIFKCIDVFVEPHYKKIKYYACSENLEDFFNHEFSQTLVSNTLDGTTIFKWEVEFKNSENNQISSSALEAYKISKTNCLKRWSEYLSNNKKEFINYESIMIEATRKEIWDVITNWCVLRSISPCLVDEAEYVGDELKEGSHLRLIYRTKIKVACDFKIVKVRYDIYCQDWEYIMALYDSCPKIPYQEIRFSIVYLDTDKSFLTFEHLYKERLNIKMLDRISKEKKSLLNDIKNYLEK